MNAELILNGIWIFLAKYLPYFLLLTFFVILLNQKGWHRKMRLFLFSTLSLILSVGIIKLILNYFFLRPRPFVVSGIDPLVIPMGDASFPSAHAMLFFLLATLMFFWIDRKWGWWFFAGALMIGIARVVAGVHYPIDIIAGAAIGFITPFLLRYLLPESFSETPAPAHNPGS